MSDEILLEGGVAGHMNHLYDNPDLSFAKIKEILGAAAKGNLTGTEKTDGQNLMISFSVREGRAKAVRNKSEVESGGLTPEQLAKKFANRENPALKDTFSDALRAFERAVQGLSNEQQIELFGKDTNIFYNAEVMDPRAPNVINYDTKTLVIHRVGHFEYDREQKRATNRDLSNEAKTLESIVENAQEQTKHDNYAVQVNAVKKLKALSDKRPLNTAISKINSLLSDVNGLIKSPRLRLSDNSTVSDFMTARIYILINSMLKRGKIESLDPVAKMNIAKRLLGVKGISVRDISAKVSKEQLDFVKEHFLNDTSKREILKTAIFPLENIISDFSVEMLRGLESAFILDNTKEIKRLRGELEGAINAISTSGSDEAMAILKMQMQKLKSVQNVDAAAEGFVFDYDGVTYKFTGNFAPINQILGLFKYGRGSVPPLKKLQEAKMNGALTIAVIPGAFKPPHKGHLHMVKQYAKMADRVIVLISPIPRDLPSGLPVTFAVSKKIWDMYLKAEGLSGKVLVLESPFSSPVRSAFDFIENEKNLPDFAQPGQTVILGTSSKGDDAARFSDDAQKHARPGVTVVVAPAKPLGEISATDMRNAIDNGDASALKKFLPDSVNKSKMAAEILALFGKNKKVAESTLYDIIIEQLAKSGTKYSLLVKKKIVKQEESAMAAGAVAGAIKPLELNEDE